MSGESTGLIVIPLALASMPLLLGGLAVAGVIAVSVKAGQAAVRYEQEQRRQREQIRTSNAAVEIGSFRREMQQSMNEQSARNAEISREMMRALERQRGELRQAAEQQNSQAFADYANRMRDSHARMTESLAAAQAQFDKDYRTQIGESMERVTANINQTYARYLDELRGLQNDAAAKQQRAASLAEGYLTETETLLQSLEQDFDGAKFVPRQLASLRSEYERARRMLDSGSPEAALAAAKDTAIGALEEIYAADLSRQDWENQYKLALVLSEEVKTYIESQETITEGAKTFAEKASGKALEPQVVGIRVADYTDRRTNGETMYDYYLRRAKEVYDSLRAENAQNMTTKELAETAAFLNNELYPAAVQCINRAVVNMNNAFSRQNMSEEIIDFFEEHNFMFSGYAYDENRHDKALHIGLTNDTTGEELLVTLAPELLADGDVQTRVELKQLQGDETNEQRKAYYRECVEEAVRGGTPGAQVRLQCDAATRNRLSSDTETKKRLSVEN